MASCSPIRAFCCWPGQRHSVQRHVSLSAVGTGFSGRYPAAQPTQFFWFFIATIGGIMAGSWTSGRLAGRIPAKRQIRHGFLVMCGDLHHQSGCQSDLAAHVSWALIPISLFAYGWALMVPVVTLLVLDIHPARRGLAFAAGRGGLRWPTALWPGVIAPLVVLPFGRTATGSILMMLIGLVAWIYLHHHWPDIGRHASNIK